MIRMKKISWFILGLVFLIGCESKQVIQKELKKKIIDLDLPIHVKIKKYLQENPMNWGLNDLTWLEAYYQDRNYQPMWINDSCLDSQGEQLKNFLSNTLHFGIPRVRYAKLPVAENFIEQEIINTYHLSSFLNDFKNGFIQPDSLIFSRIKPIPKDSLNHFLMHRDSILQADYLYRRFVSDTNELFLLKGLYQFCDQYPITKNRFTVKTYKEDSLYAFELMQKSLIDKGFLQDSILDSLMIASKLKLFQKAHGLYPDGKIGKYTTLALNESNYDKALRTVLAIQKWKHKAKYPDRYIRVSQGAFQLELVIADSVKSVHRIIIGKEKNKTPILKAKVHQIMLYPYWNVPYSICSKEILPELKRNPNYLDKNNMVLKRGEKVLDPYKINWSKYKEDYFPFQIVQNPGEKNSLGILKFEFHNKYSVYVHDTPNKNLFNLSTRILSHGCMRCENPFDLANQILWRDSTRKTGNSFTVDSLLKYREIVENRSIKLLNPIPIFIEYESVYCLNQKFILGIDFYQRDQEFINLF